MPRMTITIDMDNAAFDGANDEYDPNYEVARILKEVVAWVERNDLEDAEKTLTDHNGNNVGNARVTGKFPEPIKEVDEWPVVECPECGGPGLSMGSLGKRQHYRCRNCGGEFSHLEE